MKWDNQQERPEVIGWITGFVDGEGCFSVSIIRNQTTKLGWQVFPEFVVTQGEKSKNHWIYSKITSDVEVYIETEDMITTQKISLNTAYDHKKK